MDFCHGRRDFGAKLAALAAGWAWQRAWAVDPIDAAETYRGTEDPFTLGVASGMPRPDAIVLWTRLAPQPLMPSGGMLPSPVAVHWELADDAQFAKIVRRGKTIAQPQRAHAVHVDVTGLPSDRRYFFRFRAGDAVSAAGRTRTAPAADAKVGALRAALMSCQHYEQGRYVAHREAAQRDLDLVLFVGDYIYESTNPRYRHREHVGGVPHTLDEYRRRHAQYKSDPDLQACHAAHPWFVTWDDHEVENDYAGDRSPSGLDVPAFLARRAAAYQAYFEHMPLVPTLMPRAAQMPIHGQFAWGRLVDLWLLDNRQYRDPQACAEPRAAGGRRVSHCATLDAPRTMFGTAQERWLAQTLAASGRTWRVLAQSTQLCPGALATPDGDRRTATDGWDGYPQARRRLMQAAAAPGVSNVLCLGGDVHRHVAGNLRLDPADLRSPIVASEFVCAAVSSRPTPADDADRMRASNPDVVLARGGENGYALVDIDARGARCEFRSAPAPLGADAALATGAKAVVHAGRAGVEIG